MPKVTEAYLEERRQQILDAALVCFAHKGFHRTTMEDIGQEAGLSHTVAYRYFDGKEDIIVATVQQGIDRYARFYDAMADEENTLLVFERMIDEQFQRLGQPGWDIYYKVRLQLWAEVLRNERVAERALRLRNEGQMQLVALIEKGQERGQINPDLDAQAVALAISASHDGFIVQWLADPEIDIQQYRDVHMAMVRGLFTHHE